MYEVQNYYDGSRRFVALADYLGLSVDLLNFLLCQISALFLALFFRKILHPSKVPPSIRHGFALMVGLCFGYFCFGRQAFHIAALPTVCYVIIRTQNPRIVQRLVLIVAMFYLLCIHLHRQIYDYGSYALDVTGPLMIITQKVTSLAFSIHDGFTKERSDMTKAQQYHALYRLPSPIEYFSYTLNFQGIMAGPMVFYKDYIDFIEGYNFLKQNKANIYSDSSNQRHYYVEPSPVKPVIKKIIGSAICAFIFMKFVTEYPIRKINEKDFLEDASGTYKLWYLIVGTTVVRFKYYHAWLLSEAICNNSGLGFTGFDRDGAPKWDLVSNINVLAFEFSTNMRNAINNWNIGTNHWLRIIVYERVPKKYGTILTFSLSALWHGFYPGYYITFATGALFVMAARSGRRLFRYRFQETLLSRVLYDLITCLLTRVAMGYTTFPFVALEFKGSIRMYLNLYMCLHVVAILTIVVLPLLLQPESRRRAYKNPAVNVQFDSQKLKPYTQNSSIKMNEPSDDLIYVYGMDSNGKEAIGIQHDECEMDNLSNKLKEKIEIETRNIEDFLDKTVSGIVELRDDLMRMNDTDKIYVPNDSNLRKRTNNEKPEGVDAFLKKEICVLNAAVQQANVIPAVLSNTHAK